jgi:hypothetical protein
MKIYNENGEQLSVSDLLYKTVENVDGTIGSVCLILSSDDGTEGIDEKNIGRISQRIGEHDGVMDRFWWVIKDEGINPNYGDEE